MYAAVFLSAIAAVTQANLQAALDQIREEQDVPGVSAAVIVDGEIVFAGGSGVADIELSRPMTADTVLYMGSLSKVLTAVLALTMVEDDRLSLDDAVDGIATAAEEPDRQITIEQLLTHWSGLEREGDFGYWFSADFPDAAALQDYLRRTTLRAPPGTDLHYSNVAYATLGAYLERISDTSYAELLHARVLEPLGLTSTGVPGPAPNVANGYTPRNRIIPSAEHPFAGVGEAVGDRHVRMYHDARAMSPAFGIYTTANDLVRVANFLLGNGSEGVLSQDMRRQMRTRQASGWGLGLKVRRYRGRIVNRHDGWFAAHRSHLLLDAEAGVAVVVMTNADNATPGKIADALYDAVIGRSDAATSESP